VGHLEALAERLGVDVVYEPLNSDEVNVRGGLCRIRGTYAIFIDVATPPEQRLEILARGLARFDTENMYLPPYVRTILEHVRTRDSSGNIGVHYVDGI
jgi:hypothetical protein